MVPPWLCRGGLSLERQISGYLLRQMMDIHWRSKHMIVLIKFLEKRNSIMKENFPQYIKNIWNHLYCKAMLSAFIAGMKRNGYETWCCVHSALLWRSLLISILLGAILSLSSLSPLQIPPNKYLWLQSCSLLICISILPVPWFFKITNLITSTPDITLAAIPR